MTPRPGTEPPGLGSELESLEASPRAAGVILALGVAFDLAFNQQRAGLTIPLFVILLAASVRAVAPRSVETDILLGTAVILAVFTVFRAGEELIALDVLGSFVLLGLAATQDVGRVSNASVRSLATRALALGRRSIEAPRFLIAPLTRRGIDRDGTRSRRVARAVVVVAPVLVLFAALLASGDRVFARFLGHIAPQLDPPSLALHVVLTLVGISIAGVLWRVTLGDARPEEPAPSRGFPREPFSFAEMAAVLAGIDILFAFFVFVQFAYLFGGRERVLVTQGLTYAEYARSGFFQLAAVAALTVVVILGAWDLGRRQTGAHERWFRRLVTVMVALTGIILVSALRRLALYEGTFGFTIDRFYGYAAIVSIGAVLLVVGAAIWTGRRDRLVAGVIATGLVALLTVNVIGPDHFVAERNVARYDAIGRIDASYLGAMLGPDAIPVTAPLLRRLAPIDREALLTGLCRSLFNAVSTEPSWRSWNVGRARARSALEGAGVTAAICDQVLSSQQVG